MSDDKINLSESDDNKDSVDSPSPAQIELERLSREEEEINRRMMEIRDKKKLLQEEERLRIIREKRIEILLIEVKKKNAYVNDWVLVARALSREDVLEAWKKVNGRQWIGYEYTTPPVKGEQFGINQFPIESYENAKEVFSKLENVELKWASKEIEDEYNRIKSAPAWIVTIETRRKIKQFAIVKGPKAKQSLSGIRHTIPGSQRIESHAEALWTVPLSEGWRIWDFLKVYENIVYTDEAKDEILGQIAHRLRLDEIAQKKMTDFIIELNNNKLKPFQGVGIEFLVEADGRVILADATGLGKTWQTVGFAEFKRRTNPNFMTICSVKAANMRNWAREIERLTGIVPIIITNKNGDKLNAIIKLQARHPYFIISHDTMGTYDEKDENGHVNEYFWPAYFKECKPDLLIIDEAHQIKNPDAHRTKAALSMKGETPHIITATASPILNRTKELWPLLTLVDPEKFASQTQFELNYTYDGKVPRNVQQLHEMLRPIFLRRTKKDVLKDLPPINRIEQIIDLSDEALREYQLVMSGIYRKVNAMGEITELEVNGILPEITRCLQICSRDKVVHTVDKATSLIDESEDPTSKVLIFSKFIESAYKISQSLGSEAVTSTFRNGDGWSSYNANERDRIFEAARHDRSVRYIVTTEAAKEGHNLEFCDWVIFNDQFWTPAAHDQAEGRAYGRLSDPHPIDSIYIFADIMIERFMQEILMEKFKIIEQTTDSVETTRVMSMNIGKELLKRIKEEMRMKGIKA